MGQQIFQKTNISRETAKKDCRNRLQSRQKHCRDHKYKCLSSVNIYNCSPILSLKATHLIAAGVNPP